MTIYAGLAAHGLHQCFCDGEPQARADPLSQPPTSIMSFYVMSGEQSGTGLEGGVSGLGETRETQARQEGGWRVGKRL